MTAKAKKAAETTPPETEPQLDTYTWSEGDAPVETHTPEAPAKELEFDKVARIHNEIRQLLRKYAEEYPKHIDIVAIWMAGSVPRPYIVRSMDLKDSEAMDLEVMDQCKELLERLQEQAAKDKSIDPRSVFITNQDQEKIMNRVLVAKFTLYAENIAQLIEEGTIKPGDYAELYKTIASLSGYFPAQYETEEEPMEIEPDGISTSLRKGTKLERP